MRGYAMVWVIVTSEEKSDDKKTHVMFVMDKLVPGQVFL
jgi:hypothetical protein